MAQDSYRRGRDVERDAERPPVVSRYRRLLPVLWVVGALLFLVTVPLGQGAPTMVLLVTHLFFGSLVFGDIRRLRRQGLTWGYSRHLWVAAAFVLPLAVLAYYLYSGRRVEAENARRERESEPDSAETTRTEEHATTEARTDPATDPTTDAPTDAN